jgi:hypothetical protein
LWYKKSSILQPSRAGFEFATVSSILVPKRLSHLLFFSSILVVFGVGCSRVLAEPDVTTHLTQVGYIPTEIGLDTGLKLADENLQEPGEKTISVASPMVDCLGTPRFSCKELANAIYMAKHIDACTVRLIDGASTIPLEGSSTVITVRLSDEMGFGDLDGDGIEEAAVMLVTDTGESGVFYDLAALKNHEGDLINVAIHFLGDGVVVKDLSIDQGQILVRMVVPGPEDPLCCPTLSVEQRFILEGKDLLLVK